MTHVNVYFQKQEDGEHKNESEQEEVGATKFIYVSGQNNCRQTGHNKTDLARNI